MAGWKPLVNTARPAYILSVTARRSGSHILRPRLYTMSLGISMYRAENLGEHLPIRRHLRMVRAKTFLGDLKRTTNEPLGVSVVALNNILRLFLMRPSKLWFKSCNRESMAFG